MAEEPAGTIGRFVSLRLEEVGDFQLWELGRDLLEPFNEYVTRAYTTMRAERYAWIPPEDYREALTAENARFFQNSRVFLVRHRSGRMVASFGAFLRKAGVTLPLESQFGLTVEGIVARLALDPNQIWYSWRGSVDYGNFAELGASGALVAQLHRKLIQLYVRAFAARDTDLILGVTTRSISRMLRMNGMRFQKLGEELFVNGTMQMPVALIVRDFRNELRETRPDLFAEYFPGEIAAV